MNWSKLLPARQRLVPFWVLAGLLVAAPWAWDYWHKRQEPTPSGSAGAPIAARPNDPTDQDQAKLLGAARTVLSVHDGDTIMVSRGAERERVRLACIDAPEIAQAPFGAASRDHLRAIIPKQVYLRVQDTDRFGRTVAEVLNLDGDNVNLRMIRDGEAVVYRKYCKDSSYTSAEASAKISGLGVWARPGDHQTPWVYRHRAPQR